MDSWLPYLLFAVVVIGLVGAILWAVRLTDNDEDRAP
jgi:hypothetical protein